MKNFWINKHNKKMKDERKIEEIDAAKKLALRKKLFSYFNLNRKP